MTAAPDDTDLLRRYAEDRDQAAFAELVRRHIDLVHSAALRQLNGDAHLAQDATQLVFVALAQKAAALTRHRVLAGWLFTSTRYAAAKLVRAEQRRVARETTAHTMLSADTDDRNPSTAAFADWDRVRPVLDAALADLSPADRDIVLLRFFEGRDFPDIGARLSLNANAARMRVERALAKLHTRLARRGVTSTPAALALALGAQAVTAAPVGLAATVTGAALAGGTATLGLSVAGIFAVMKTSNALLSLAAVVAIVGFGAAFVAQRSTAREVDTALTVAVARDTATQAGLAALESRLQSARAGTQQAEKENARLLALAREQQISVQIEAETESITSATVTARLQRAQTLARTGPYAEALREMEWCFDIGTRRTAYGSMTREIPLMMAWADLAKIYPPARAALEERREKSRHLMTPDKAGEEIAVDFGAINGALGDQAATVAAMDEFPMGDARRKALAGRAIDRLIELRRYADAASAGTMSPVVMSATVDRLKPVTATPLDADAQKGNDLGFARFAQYVEVLAGTGEIDRAREAVVRAQQIDNSEHIRTLLRERVIRAGQPPAAVGLGER